jgi:hypothetical protein
LETVTTYKATECPEDVTAHRQLAGKRTHPREENEPLAGRSAGAVTVLVAVMMMPVIIFDTSSEDGLRITAVEFRRE